MNPAPLFLHKAFAPGTYCKLEGSIALLDNLHGVNPLAPLFESKGTYLNEHSFYLMIVRGEIELKLNKDNVSMTVRDGLYLAPHARIRFLRVSHDLQFIGYGVATEFLRSLHADLGFQYEAFRQQSQYKVVNMRAEEFRYRQNLYNEFLKEMQRPDTGFRRVIVRCYSQILFINDFDIYNLSMTSPRQRVSRQRRQYMRFLDLLEEHSPQVRSVQFYAAQLGITPKYLSTLCLDYGGKNASAIIEQHVVSHAVRLMRERRYSIKQVSEMLNFPSQSFFGRYFKRSTGLPPRAYMLKN